MGLEIEEEEERKRRNDYELVPMCVSPMFSLSNDKVSASLIRKEKSISSYLKRCNMLI